MKQEITLNVKMTLDLEELRILLDILKIEDMPEQTKIDIEEQAVPRKNPNIEERGVSYDKSTGTWRVQKSIFGVNIMIESGLDKDHAIEYNRQFRKALEKDGGYRRMQKIKRVRQSGALFLAFANNRGVEEYVGSYSTRELAEKVATGRQRKISKQYVNMIKAKMAGGKNA